MKLRKILALAVGAIMSLSCVPAMAEETADYTSLVYAQVESGPIIGYTVEGVNTFRGVPYAKAARYQAPEKADAWTEPRPCFNYGLVSYSNANGPTAVKFTGFMTPTSYRWVQGEDCQNLNIWTPSMNAEDKLAVVVFMHGGGGNAQELTYYDGTNLAKSGNIVFVSVNHRENTLGSLDLSAYGDAYKYSAYCEYLDILASLQWVKDNIANFGGDPENVTLMGQSAGSGNVQTLMSMPSAWGLYSKIVLNSGATMRAPITATHADTQALAAKLLEKLGLTAETVDQIAEIPYADLTAAYTEVVGWASLPLDEEFYPSPVYIDGEEIEQNKQIPMMISTVYSEMSDNFAGVVMGTGIDTMYRPDVDEAKVMALLTAKYGDKTDTVVEMFKAAFPQHDLFDALYINLPRLMGRDYEVAKMRAANGGAPVYAAVYCYNMPLFGGTVAVHTDGDLPYIFNNIDKIDYQVAGDEEMAQKVADEASMALCNFARTGDPNGEGVPAWPAFDATDGMTMYFDRISEARTYHLDDDLLTFMAENQIVEAQ